ncbi:hypothetical protein NBG4_110043 [Candidatus Sulfobium mesophilum]|uniref:Uncharacterized protein n=1 Tax=Candidatus Sulfobium mesophilum TaxID=2016548 RepID=A0A2U3QEH0_9BACT|nr:hypothetical protein NBG4_110043 [Candidatus Sulfobium mesophilum]
MTENNCQMCGSDNSANILISALTTGQFRRMLQSKGIITCPPFWGEGEQAGTGRPYPSFILKCTIKGRLITIICCMEYQ